MFAAVDEKYVGLAFAVKVEWKRNCAGYLFRVPL